ncbi:hypothetical protein FQN54_005408 [Arachnomyces sp. PD_36]|nr:hypothetical protein FQN54_005408 [Arachnomyces sp. PD_36]
MMDTAAVITISVGLSIILFLGVSLILVFLLRVRRVQDIRENRIPRISLPITEDNYGRCSTIQATGARLNETDGYSAIAQSYDAEHGNQSSHVKDRWGSLRNHIPLPRQPAFKSICKAIASNYLSPLSALIQKTLNWNYTSAPNDVAELPSESSPRNTFENQESAVSVASRDRDSLATYLQSPRSKSLSDSPIPSLLNADLGGRVSPIPGPPPSKPPPALPSKCAPNRQDPPGRRSTSRGSALSSKTTDTSILDVCTSLRPRRSVDLPGLPTPATFHSFKLEGRPRGTPSDVTRVPPPARAKFGRYASWTSSNSRHSGWEQYPLSKGYSSRSSACQTRERASYIPVASDSLAEKFDSPDPPTMPKRAVKRDKVVSIPDPASICETCRANTPEHWDRSEPSIRPELPGNQNFPSPLVSMSNPIEKAKPQLSLSKGQLNPNPFPTPSMATPVGRPSRIPSPTRSSRPAQERWPVLPAAKEPCKNISTGKPPSASAITTCETELKPDVSSPAGRIGAKPSRYHLAENPIIMQEAIPRISSEPSSSFPNQCSEPSHKPRGVLQESVSLQEKSSSYPPSLYWPPIRPLAPRPLAPSHSADDLRKSIMKLRRMNSETKGRSRSLYFYLQCDELPDNSISVVNIGGSDGNNGHHSTDQNTYTKSSSSKSSKGHEDMAIIPHKSSSIRSNTTTVGASTWEDASLSTSYGQPSFLSGRVSLEWPPRNEKRSPAHAWDMTSAQDIASQRHDGGCSNLHLVVPGSLYDSNGFLKE